jgi:hypothetical protein
MGSKTMQSSPAFPPVLTRDKLLEIERGEFIFTGEPADAHEQEVFRKRSPTLELRECRLTMLCQILPNPACGLANLGVYRVLLLTTRAVPLSTEKVYTPPSTKGNTLLQLAISAMRLSTQEGGEGRAYQRVRVT